MKMSLDRITARWKWFWSKSGAIFRIQTMIPFKRDMLEKCIKNFQWAIRGLPMLV